VTVHLGAWPWPSSDVDPDDYTNLPFNDKVRLSHFGGGVPFLGYSFVPGVSGSYAPQTWAWLSEHGYRDCILRLWSTDPLPSPADYVQSHEEGIARAIQAKQSIILQPTNEPNLEHASMGAAGFAAWESEVIDRLLNKYPTLQVCSSPMAQDAPNTAEWRAACLPNIAKCHFQGFHYYHGRKAGDELPGAIESPEWAHEHYSAKPMCITEAGSWANKLDVGTMFRRWTQYPWVRSIHWFILSAPNWPQFAFDDDCANLCFELCKEWRSIRSFPAGTTPPQPPTGSLDRWRLREHISPQYELCSRMRARVAAGDWAGAASDAGEIYDRAKMIWDEFDLDNATP
jgi:hypothetical protein